MLDGKARGHIDILMCTARILVQSISIWVEEWGKAYRYAQVHCSILCKEHIDMVVLWGVGHIDMGFGWDSISGLSISICSCYAQQSISICTVLGPPDYFVREYKRDPFSLPSSF